MMHGRDMAQDFDVEAFLARPLVAHLATTGPAVRPVWYLWEEGAFWIITGFWSRVADQLARESKASLVVDSCDLDSGEVLQVRAAGVAELVPYDVERARRKLVRYLGPDESRWDGDRFASVPEDGESRFIQLVPDRLVARDLSYRVR